MANLVFMKCAKNQSQLPRGLRRGSASFRDCRFESCWGHGFLSFVSVLRGQVEVSRNGRSLVRRSPTERNVPVISKP